MVCIITFLYITYHILILEVTPLASEFIDSMISFKDISALQRLKCSLDVFFSVTNFAKKFSSSSCGSSLSVGFFITVFADLRWSLRFLEYFDFLP